MRRTIRILFPILIVIGIATYIIRQLFFPTPICYINERPTSYPFTETRKIARRNMSSLFQSTGTLGTEEVQRARLGVPYILYNLETELLAKASYQKEHFREQLQGGTYINFPVFVDGALRSTIGVSYSAGKWRANAAGGNSQNIVRLQQQLSAKGIDARVDLVEWVIQPMQPYLSFGMLDYQNQLWLIPIANYEEPVPALDMSGNRMYTLDEILPILAQQAQKTSSSAFQANCIYKQRPTDVASPLPAPTRTPDLSLYRPTSITLNDIQFMSRKLPRPASYNFDELASMARTKMPKEWQVQDGVVYYDDVDDPGQLMFGKPYIHYMIDMQHMAGPEYARQSFQDDLSGGGEVSFPILVDGEVINSISLFYVDGLWQASQGTLGSYYTQSVPFHELQKRLAARAISERVDSLSFGFSTSFGLIQYQGQTMLIPINDPGGLFPELDFKSDRMYSLAEIVPLLHERAQQLIAEAERQQREATPRPALPAYPVEPTASAYPGT